MSYPNAVSLAVSDGTQAQAYTAFPAAAAGPRPGLILLQEAFGVNAHIRSVADRLAQAGYVVIAPELYHRSAAPGQEWAYSDIASAMPHMQAAPPATLTADLQAAYAWLQAQDVVIKDKIGAIGFCMGGRVAFLANAVLPLAAAVSYYGGRTHTLKDRAPELHAPHLFFWGGQDTHIPREQREEVIAAVEAAGKPHINTVISYAEHGFNCDARASYHPEAAAEAWALTLAFFQQKLG
jgi:carboxymethylenebutenolidase